MYHVGRLTRLLVPRESIGDLFQPRSDDLQTCELNAGRGPAIFPGSTSRGLDFCLGFCATDR